MKHYNLLEEIQRMKSLMVYDTGEYKDKVFEERNMLLKEDIDPNYGGTIIINNVYQAGYYTTKAIDQLTKKTIKEQLDEQLIKVTEFLKNHKNDSTIVSVKFTSQESAIPNTDNERAGFFKTRRLNVGQLSSARKYYIDEYIKSYFKNLKEKGVISDSVDIPPIEYTFKKPVKLFKSADKKITPWCVSTDTQIPKDDTQGYACTGGEFKVDGKTETNWRNSKKTGYKDHYKEFVKEQNSSIEITVKVVESEKEPDPEPEEIPKEIPEEKVTLTYEDDVTPIPVTESCASGLQIKLQTKSHECNNAEYFIYANNTLLKNINGGDTHNGNNAATRKTVLGKKLAPQALNPGYGLLGTKKYGTYGDIKGTRADVFKVTPEQSKEITSDAKDGSIKIWAICANGDKCHTDQATVVITHPKRDKNVFGPKKVNGDQILLTVLSSCGDAVVTETSQSKLSKTKPDATGAKNEYVKTRFELTQKVLSKDPKALENAKDDAKAVLLQNVQDFTSIGDDLIDYIEKLYLEVYEKAKSKGVEKQKNKVFDSFNKNLNKFLGDNTSDLSRYVNRYGKYYKGSDFEVGKVNDKKSNFYLGDESFAFKDKYIRTNELANDIRFYLEKTFNTLNQIATINSIKNGNLELDKSKIFYSLWNDGRLKRSRDIVVDDENSNDITNNED